MPWRNLGTLGSANSPTDNQASATLTTTQACNAGDVVILAIAVDNATAGADGDEGAVTSVTFGAENAVEGKEWANTQAAALAGATAAVWWKTLAGSLASSSTITVNFSSSASRDASALSAWRFRFDPDQVALLHFDGADASTTITNSAPSANAFVVVGNAQLDTAQSKFGTASLLLDGTGDYITGPGITSADSDFVFGTGNFTIEMFVRLNQLPSVAAENKFLYDGTPSGVGSTVFPLLYIATDDTLRYFVNADQITGTTALTTGQWYHVLLARSGTSTKLFLDGVQEGSTFSDSTNYPANAGGANRPAIGANGSSAGANSLNGWIDEVRVLKGTAAQTGNFSPPTSAYSTAAAATVSVDGTPAGISADGGTNLGSITITTAGDALRFRAVATESSLTTAIGVSNIGGNLFTAISQSVTTGGGAATNMGVRGEFRIDAQTGVESSPTGPSADHASAMFALKGVSVADPTGVGSASGVGTAAAVGTAIKHIVGSASGTGAAAAVGNAITARVGSAAGVGAAAAVGTGIRAAVGSATGTGAAVAVGESIAGATEAVGSAAGVGAAAAIGAATASASASAAGVGTAVAVGAATAAATGTAAGTGAAAAVGQGITGATEAAGSAAGTGAAAAVGQAIVARAGSAAGTGVALGQIGLRGVAGGTGVATAVGVTIVARAGVASGVGAASAVSRTIRAAVGSAAGVGAAAGVSASGIAVGTAAGIGTAEARSEAIISVVGSASGVGVAIAEGAGLILGIAETIGSAHGIGLAQGITEIPAIIPTYNYPIGRRLDSDYGIRGSKLGRQRFVIGRR